MNPLKEFQDNIKKYLTRISETKPDFFLVWFPKEHKDIHQTADYDLMFVTAGKCHFMRMIAPDDKWSFENHEHLRQIKEARDGRIVASGAAFLDVTNDIDALDYLKKLIE